MADYQFEDVERKFAKWTAEEDARITRDYQRLGAPVLARLMKRGVASVRSRASFLGVTRQKKAWL